MAKAPKAATPPQVKEEPKMTARTAVTATGLALLSLIAQHEAEAPGYVMLTKDEAGEVVAAGQAAVDGTIVNAEDGTAAVRLTDAGRAALEAAQNQTVENTNVAAGKQPSAGFAIDTDVPLPTGAKKRSAGRGSTYPFEQLEIGQSFHVAPTTAQPDPFVSLASTVTSARARFAAEVIGADGKPEMETVKRAVYETGEDGKRLKGADGKLIKKGETDVTRPKTKLTRDFQLVKVDATDPRGVGARVFRIA